MTRSEALEQFIEDMHREINELELLIEACGQDLKDKPFSDIYQEQLQDTLHQLGEAKAELASLKE